MARSCPPLFVRFDWSQVMPVLQMGERKTPVVYMERRDKEMSGWVQYLTTAQIKTVGTSARVSLGALPAGGAAKKTGGGDSAVTPQSMVATRKQVEASLNPDGVVGSVVSASLTLAIAAAQGIALSKAHTITPGAKKRAPNREAAGPLVSAKSECDRDLVLLTPAAALPPALPERQRSALSSAHADLSSASAAIAHALATPLPPPKTSIGPDGRSHPPHPSLLLRSAASGSDVGLATLYDRMAALVGPSAPSTLRKVSEAFFVRAAAPR